MPARKAIIAGGRTFHLRAEHFLYLNDLLKAPGFDEVVHGCAPGVDSDADAWARRQDLKITRFAADWAKHGRSAGPKRNERMGIYVSPDGLCILFPGGKGTASMRLIALARGLTVYAYPSLRPVSK